MDYLCVEKNGVEMKRVRCKDARGMNMSWNLNLFSGPKWEVKCGECSYWFSARLSMRNNPEVICPACKTINIIPVSYT